MLTGISIGLVIGAAIGFRCCSMLTTGQEPEHERFWRLLARIHQCPGCGEMRTETEANDGECYACDSTGFKNTGVKK